MNIPAAVVLLLAIAVCGSAAALAAFVWAVWSGQLDHPDAAARVIFDEEDAR